MRVRLVSIPLLLALVLAPGVAHSQCQDWLAGPLGGANGTDGTVLALASWDPDGAGPKAALLVAGGTFQNIQGVPSSHVSARDPQTGLWQSLGNPAFPALVVYALGLYNGELIAGGSFTALGQQPVNRVARWDGTSWQPLGTGIDDQEVRALTVYNGELIAAGVFTTIGGQARSNIARWNGSTWQPLGSGTNGIILALTVYNGELIAGGSFTVAGGVSANRIARWNGSVWQALGTGMNTSVYGLTVYGSELIASGAFTTAGGPAANHIARWNGSSWQTLGSGTDNAVRAVTVYNGSLIAGGLFSTAGGNSATCVARWSGTAWFPMGIGISGSAPDVRVLGNYSTELIAGGTFESAGAAANNIARWNGALWTSFGGGTSTSVMAFVNYHGRMVGAGDFSQSTPGVQATNIVGWDGVKCSSFGSGTNNQVLALEAFKYSGIGGDYELIAGGSFTAAGGIGASCIARWDEDPFVGIPPPAWQAMGAGFNGDVYAIERFNGDTYAAGSFTLSSGAVSRIARWNEMTDVWEPLGTGMNNAVYALKAYGSFLYAGGEFTTAGGVATGGLARWNGSTWSQVGGNFLGTVYALEVHNNELVIGGLYPGINASPNLASYNGSTYSTYATGGTSAAVRALTSLGGRLYVGGDFTTAGGVAANYVAYWDGAWHEATGGTDKIVLALAPYLSEIQVGGLFQNVRGSLLSSRDWGRYSASGVPWIAYHPNSQNVNPGDDASFTVQPAAGYDGLSYQWYRFSTPLADGPTGNGSTMSGTTGATLTVTDATTTDAGQYWVAVGNGCGNDSSFMASLTVGGFTAVPLPEMAERTVFEALGPNPSGGESQLTFSLAHAADVRVQVHDVSGRLVRQLDIGRLPAGRHQASWDGRGSHGAPVRAGLFFVTLEVEGRSTGIKRLAIVR